VRREANFSGVSFVGSKVMTRSMDYFQQSRVVNFAQAVKIKAASVGGDLIKPSAHFAFCGTFEICPPILRMSVHRLRPEVAMDSKRTSARRPTSLRCQKPDVLSSCDLACSRAASLRYPKGL
jgi:hypothetical protein